MDARPPKSIIVVSHTHWDREWYHPLGVMRTRLAALIDALLDAPDGLPFLLDGQAIVLDDYLAMRPERHEALREALRTRQLEAGPWYVLADMLIPSGEALVRNLLFGMRTVRDAGGDPPAVLYSPDAFGHAAAGPVLADGFGVDVAVVWRGYGGPSHPSSAVARWTHPSGASVLLYHLPTGGYEVGSSLPTTASGARQWWRDTRDALIASNPLDVVLLPNGADHHARQRDRLHAIGLLTDAARPDQIEARSLRDFAVLLHDAASGHRLPEVQGELRDSSGWTWSLQGTFATRAQQKRGNAHIELLLVREAEPWAALAWFTSGWRGATLRSAWTTLLAAHPHDTLCGCSVDDVALAADQRWAEARQHGRAVRDAAVEHLLGHDASAQRDLEPDWRPAVVLRNPAARARGGAVLLRLLDHAVPDPVGPGSAARSAARIAPPAVPPEWTSNEHLQLLHRSRAFDRVESPQHYPRNAVVRVSQMMAWIDPIGGYALHSVPLRSLDTLVQPVPGALRVHGTEGELTGPHWRLRSREHGATAVHTASGARLESLGWLESTTDAGDTYTPSLRGEPMRAPWSAPRLLARGPLRASFEVSTMLERPRFAVAAAVEPSGHVPPSREHGAVHATATVSIDAGADRIDIHIRGDNSAGDHRLRWVLPLPAGTHVAQHSADAAFGAVVRAHNSRDPRAWSAELRLSTAPLHRWLWFTGDTHGFGVISDGLAEYEVLQDGHLAITLLRAVGELSRRDLPERPGHAGWPLATPLAQSLGPFEARFALLALPQDAEAALQQLEHAADDVLLPIHADTWRGVAVPHTPFGGIKLEGDGLTCSAIRHSEDGDWLVLRCINQRATAVRGVWHLPRAASQVCQSRLDETPGQPLTGDGPRIRFEAAPHAVTTLLVR